MIVDSKGMTVKQLHGFTNELIKKGLGDKRILITTDDEGNGYHTLFYQFTEDIESIKQCYDCGLFHDNNDPTEVVLLG